MRLDRYAQSERAAIVWGLDFQAVANPIHRPIPANDGGGVEACVTQRVAPGSAVVHRRQRGGGVTPPDPGGEWRLLGPPPDNSIGVCRGRQLLG
jgi:hypothetical protein